MTHFFFLNFELLFVYVLKLTFMAALMRTCLKSLPFINLSTLICSEVQVTRGF